MEPANPSQPDVVLSQIVNNFASQGLSVLALSQMDAGEAVNSILKGVAWSQVVTPFVLKAKPVWVRQRAGAAEPANPSQPAAASYPIASNNVPMGSFARVPLQGDAEETVNSIRKGVVSSVAAVFSVLPVRLV